MTTNNKATSNPPKFNTGHFPVGTVCEVFVGSVHEQPIVVEVTALRANGPNSFVIETNIYNQVCEMYDAYNIEYVTRIIKRGTGSNRVRRSYLDRCSLASWSSINDFPKHRNHYMGWRGAEDLLVRIISAEMQPDDGIVNLEQLLEVVCCQNVLRYDSLGNTFTVSKKKLRNIIKRNINRCLTKRVELQEEKDTQDAEMYWSSIDQYE